MGAERRGRVICGCSVAINRELREEIDERARGRQESRSISRSAWCGRRTRRSRPTRERPGWTGSRSAEFEADLKNNLYKLWNRMSSGSTSRRRCGRWRYRSAGGVRGFSACPLSLTGSRRPWRRWRWRPRTELVFHQDSYGYRPGRGRAGRGGGMPASGAGRRTGLSTLMSRSSSTASAGT